MEEVQPYPKWKQAVLDFIHLNPQPGHIVTEKWRQEHFEIQPVTYGSKSQMKQYDLRMLTALGNFTRILMEDYHIHLKSVKGGNYVVLAPNEQTRVAVTDCDKEILKSLSKSKFRLNNVATDQLTAEERKEATDAQCRLAMQATMFRKTKKYKLPQ